MERPAESIAALKKIILETRYSDLERDKSCCEELLALAREQGDFEAQAFAYTYLGDYFIATNQLPLCLQHLHTAQLLCEEHELYKLLLTVCHLSGLYFTMCYDNSAAIQKYLEGLDLARRLGDTLQEGTILNNIAYIFRVHESALHYFELAYEKLGHDQSPQSARSRLVLLSNLIESSLLVKNLTAARSYLEECARVETPDDASVAYCDSEAGFKELALLIGQCLYQSAIGQHREAAALANQLLSMEFGQSSSKTLIFEQLMPVGEAMIHLGIKPEATRLVELLGTLCDYAGPSGVARYTTLKVEYSEAFLPPQQVCSVYHDYYIAMRKSKELEQAAQIAGLDSKIRLYETTQQNHLLEDKICLDELTGLYNRRYFNKMCTKVTDGETGLQAGLIMLDVDYFKEYNDRYGHARGDVVLKTVSSLLKSAAPVGMDVCRFGGDEFVCLCTGLADTAIEAYLEQVLTGLRELEIEHSTSGCGQWLSLSAGYSNSILGPGWQADVLLGQADQALYKAKARGRNCFCQPVP